ncbi:MAG TPA: DNA repair ATPase [Vicinamibacteria bacterium]|nr:DNA repair ATPase [Vicinamibacteria bacterium]
MLAFLTTVLSFPTVVFTVLLGLTLLYWLVVIAGAVDLDFLDGVVGLDDAQILHAKLGTLIVMKVLPYREHEWRYLVFNTRTKRVDRIDAIGQACVQLPEDHGIIFPGGYYLKSGETKTFDRQIEKMEFLKRIRSPNGEDVLYCFHERGSGRSILLPYNLIRKEVDNPLGCHGFSLYPDGTLVIFRGESDEPKRVHTMQVWRTPFLSEEHVKTKPPTGSSWRTLETPTSSAGSRISWASVAWSTSRSRLARNMRTW